jgi:hypothetical protein
MSVKIINVDQADMWIEEPVGKWLNSLILEEIYHWDAGESFLPMTGAGSG